MDIKIADLAFDSLMFFSSLFALLAAIVVITVPFIVPEISIHVILEAIVLAFFGVWGLVIWYREVS